MFCKSIITDPNADFLIRTYFKNVDNNQDPIEASQVSEDVANLVNGMIKQLNTDNQYNQSVGQKIVLSGISLKDRLLKIRKHPCFKIFLILDNCPNVVMVKKFLEFSLFEDTTLKIFSALKEGDDSLLRKADALALDKNTPWDLLNLDNCKNIKHIQLNFDGRELNPEIVAKISQLFLEVTSCDFDIVKASIFGKESDFDSKLICYFLDNKAIKFALFAIDAGLGLNSMAKKEYSLLNFQPLHYAAYMGEVEIVEKFITKGLDVNSVNKDGDTPLHFAMGSKEIEIVEKLLKLGADVNIRNKKGETPLQYLIVVTQNIDIKELMLKKLIEVGAKVDVKNSNHQTPLHLASVAGKSKIASVLISANANVEAKTSLGETPLHYAASHAQTEMIQILKADVNAKNQYGDTPLHYAALLGHTDMARELIKAGAEVESLNDNEDTPLHYAAARGQTDVVSFLVEVKANVNAKNSNDETPLHCVGLLGNSETAEKLISLGADVNSENCKNQTPLHYAAMKRDWSMWEESGAEARRRINENAILLEGDPDRTPTSDVSREAHLETVKVLMKAGAIVNVKDMSGRTPADFALACWGKDVVGGESVDNVIVQALTETVPAENA